MPIREAPPIVVALYCECGEGEINDGIDDPRNALPADDDGRLPGMADDDEVLIKGSDVDGWGIFNREKLDTEYGGIAPDCWLLPYGGFPLGNVSSLDTFSLPGLLFCILLAIYCRYMLNMVWQ